MLRREYLTQVRDKYIEFYRSVLQSKRGEGLECVAEVWVEPHVPPGGKRPPHPLCVDIMVNGAGGQSMAMVAGEPIEGSLVDEAQVGSATLRVYETTWENFAVWIRHPDPDWQQLIPWSKKWMDPEKGGDVNNDGLSGVVHYMGTPIAEGGGYLFQMDFGSAPIEAVIELVSIFTSMGVTEIELGRSDGSDLPPNIQATLRQPEVPMTELASILAQLLGTQDGVDGVRQVGHEQLEFKLKDENHSRQVYLGNLHRLLHRIGVEARAKEIHRQIRTCRESAQLETPDLEQLRLVIKDDRFLENVRQHAPKVVMLARKFAADLWLVCVWDSPNGMRFASDDDPEKYGLTSDQMLDRARDNLLRELAPVEVSRHGDLWVAKTGDCYDASLLINEQWCDEMTARMKGSLLACVPARHMVLLGDSSDPTCVSQLQDAARRVEAGGDHLISDTILIREGNTWKELVLSSTLNGTLILPPVAGKPSPALPKEREKRRPWWRFW